jgi:hypothetical protein
VNRILRTVRQSSLALTLVHFWTFDVYDGAPATSAQVAAVAGCTLRTMRRHVAALVTLRCLVPIGDGRYRVDLDALPRPSKEER